MHGARAGVARGRANADRAYARARVREDLLPALRAVDPRAEANVLRTAELLREEAAVLDEVVAERAGRARRQLPRAELAALPRRAGAPGPAAPGRGRHRAAPCARAAGRLGEVLALGDEGALDLGDGARAIVRDGIVSVGRTPARPAEAGSLPRLMRDPQIGEILVQPDDLKRKVREIGEQISADYAERDLLLVCVLKGAVFFLADLMRAIDIPCEVDFMAVSSYGSETDSSGVVRILKDLDRPIAGRDVLIVEDIVDSGLTLQYLLRNLGAREPASLEVCALLTKPERRKVELPTRYVGFEIPDKFAIGYGLDVAERYRNLPYVAALTEQ